MGKSARIFLFTPFNPLDGEGVKEKNPPKPTFTNSTTTAYKMEFPPGDWYIFEAVNFETAPPRNAAEICVEVMAQVRPNGRVMDHWRIATGGTSMLKTSVDLATIIPAAAVLPKCTLTYEMWPADIGIRRNMTTSQWLDFLTIIAANEITAVDEANQPVESKTIVDNLKALPAKSVISAAIRWAVCVSEQGLLEIQLQALPAAVSSLTAKPIFKR